MGFGKSFDIDTFNFAMTLEYLKQMLVVILINVPFAMLGIWIELTIFLTMTLLLLSMARGFSKAYISYTK